jgi:hypothetical protein
MYRIPADILTAHDVMEAGVSITGTQGLEGNPTRNQNGVTDVEGTGMETGNMNEADDMQESDDMQQTDSMNAADNTKEAHDTKERGEMERSP